MNTTSAVSRSGRPAGTLALACFATAALAALLASGARAQVVRDDFWVTNGPVNAIARSGETLYIGGDFTRIGPFTGAGVPLSTASGATVDPFSRVTGIIRAVAPDGSGGWYIAGAIFSVGGQPRSEVAHVLADGSVSPFTATPNAEVYSLAVSGSTVFIGGLFFQVSGLARNRIAALDASTGALLPWNPGANGTVYALTVSGSTLYAGGAFTSIGGQARSRIAALDVVTGTVSAWNPNATGGTVYAIALSGGTVYIGGVFSSVGGQSRLELAAVSAATGAVTSWNPGATPVGLQVYALATDGATVYAGGRFTTAGGQPRNRIAAMDATTGAATSWNPNANGTVWSLVLDGSTLYAGGEFDVIGGQDREYLAALDVATGTASAWNPNPNNYVYALSLSGTTLYAGGRLNSIGGLPRNYLAALDVISGEGTAWNPNPNAPVDALAVGASPLYVGGAFTTIGGQARNYIAAIDLETGDATAFDANADDIVQALVLRRTHHPPLRPPISLYVGGCFGNIGGQVRGGLAELDLATGAATSWDPNVQRVGPPPCVSTIYYPEEGSPVSIAGAFSSVGGQPRTNLAVLEYVTGVPTAFNANLTSDQNIYAIARSQEAVYVGGDFQGMIGGQPRNYLAALDATTGNATSWNPGTDYTIMSLAQYVSLFVGGQYSTIAGQARPGIAALNTADGTASDWSPDEYVGANCMEIDGSNVYAGSSSSRGVYAITLGSVLSAPGAPGAVAIELAQNHPNPAGSSTLIEFTLPEAAPVTLSLFDLQGRRVASVLQGEMRPAGVNRIPFRPTGLSSGLYLYRVEALGRVATRKMMILE